MGLRKNQNKLTAAEKKRFTNAVLKMKTDTAAAYNYDKYPALHAAAFNGSINANPAHMGPAFFPWHRYFLLKFERDLATVDRLLGGDGLTLPYWDWTHDNSGDPGSQRGSLWKPDFLGGNGAGGNGPVTDKPFGAGAFPIPPQLPPVDPNAPTVLSRAFGVDVGSLPTEGQVKAILDLEGFDTAPWNRNPPAGPSVASPAAPALTAAAVAGGTLVAGVYRVAVTYMNPNGETRPSPEATVTLAAPNNTIQITSPRSSGSASGFHVYVSTPGGASNSKTRQTTTPTAIGTAGAVSAIAAGAAMPTFNSTGSFRNACEGWVTASGPATDAEMHNRVHVWVGGSMGPGTSPNDPVFFLHHCNIDRLWALWQYRHPGQNYPEIVATSPPSGSNRPHGLNDLMPPWTAGPEQIRPIDMLNHRAVPGGGYSYDTDPVGMTINISP